MRKIKLVALDLDLTVWDHEDISSLTPPFRRISENKIADANGIEVQLHEGVREFLEKAREKKVLVAVVSWNIREKAVQALEAFSLLKYIDLLVIEPHPRKDEMFQKIFDKFPEVAEEEVLYVDDNPEMINKVKKRYPKVNALLYGVDVKGFPELIELISGAT